MQKWESVTEQNIIFLKKIFINNLYRFYYRLLGIRLNSFAKCSNFNIILTGKNIDKQFCNKYFLNIYLKHIVILEYK